MSRRTEPAPTPAPLAFQLSAAAATQNAELLATYDYDIEQLIDAFPTSAIGYGSEFRHPNRLRPLLHRHQHWPVLEGFLKQGVSVPLREEIPDAERMAENDRQLSRGNHKSAIALQDSLHREIDKDVLAGFALPLPIALLDKIPHAMLAPWGLIRQHTRAADGSTVTKDRPTHDQSWSNNKPHSRAVNDLVDNSALPDMMFGFACPASSTRSWRFAS